MNGSELSTYNIAGIIEKRYHDDEDLKTYFHKIALTCEDEEFSTENVSKLHLLFAFSLSIGLIDIKMYCRCFSFTRE